MILPRHLFVLLATYFLFIAGNHNHLPLPLFLTGEESLFNFSLIPSLAGLWTFSLRGGDEQGGNVFF